MVHSRPSVEPSAVRQDEQPEVESAASHPSKEDSARKSWWHFLGAGAGSSEAAPSQHSQPIGSDLSAPLLPSAIIPGGSTGRASSSLPSLGHPEASLNDWLPEDKGRRAGTPGRPVPGSGNSLSSAVPDNCFHKERSEVASALAQSAMEEGTLVGVSVQQHSEQQSQGSGGEGSPRLRMIRLERQGSILSEVQVQFSMAWPLMLSTFLQLLMTMISLAFVGRLGAVPLASASIGTAFANVVGHIVLTGLASGLETLCGQAHGAGMPHLLGLYLQRGLLCLGCAALPLACAWWWAEPVLLFFREDPAIAAGAALYLRFLLPSLAANVVMQCLERFLQAQGVTFPMAGAALASVALHLPLTWLLVFHLELGYIGAPLAVSLSFCTNLTILLLYTVFSGVAKDPWAGFTWQAFHGWGEFMALAVPSTAMLCLEYWGFQILTFVAGLLPNPGLEIATFQVMLNVDFMAFVFPFGFGAAASIRVSNELGAGNPGKARYAARVGILCALVEVAIMALFLFLVRGSWGWAFTTSLPVVHYVAKLVPIGLVGVCADAMIAILSGIVRGCGYQHLAVYANLAAYYVVGIPLATLLAFHFDLRARGLLVGLVTGMVTQVALLLSIFFTTKWEGAANTAKERLKEALLASEDWKREDAECKEQADGAEAAGLS